MKLMEEKVLGILILGYLVLGYWSTGQTIYANKIYIGSGTDFAAKRFALGMVFGFILIPVALIKVLIFRK